MEYNTTSRLIGKRFGTLVVEDVFSKARTRNSKQMGSIQMVRVLCDCGIRKTMFASATYRTDILSCGCKRPLMYSK